MVVASKPRRTSFSRPLTFYVIKGDSYYSVSDLSTATNAKEGTLHGNCQGGDFYMARHGWGPGGDIASIQYGNVAASLLAKGSVPQGVYFTIIFSRRGKFRVVNDLSLCEGLGEYDLHESFKDGLYYWADTQCPDVAGEIPLLKWFIGAPKGRPHFWCLKLDTRWGLRFHHATDLERDSGGENLPFHPDVTKFLPGGLSVTEGLTYAKWECIDTIRIDTRAKRTLKVETKRGYKKEVLSSVEHNWNVRGSVTQNLGTLTEQIFKSQLSLSTSYGGKSLDSTKEEWSEEYTESDELEFDVEPGKTQYIWQYVLGIGKKTVFFSRHRRITDSPTMPDEVPIPTTSGFLTH